ncbi:hypothetical protein EYR38_003565 [Pleurotus pulmonarius]|nr:hypothetical protein EYR38_003565 [Pleurotus pulmonarius]
MSSQTSTNLQVPPTLGNFNLHQILESERSANVFLATDRDTGTDVALKVELRPKTHSKSTVYYEKRIYSLLPAKSEGIPELFSGGSVGDWEYIGVELLGPTVGTLLAESGRSCLDAHSVCCIGMQLIDRLALLHDHGILHRDIRPENCAIGIMPGMEQIVYLTSFGYGKSVRHPLRFMDDGDLPMSFFTSNRVHCEGAAYTYRDDFEALALSLIHLIKPYGLPWARRGMPQQDDHHGQQILQTTKATTAVGGLCSNIPAVFKDFLMYCRSLKANEYPDYQQWRDRLQEFVIGKGYEPASPFHWPPLPLPLTPRALRLSSPSPQQSQSGHHSPSLLTMSPGSERLSQQTLSPIPIHLPALPTNNPQESFHELVFGGRATKAVLLKMLRSDILPYANSNKKLGEAVLQFCQVLQFHRNGSYMTKDAFEFLNQLINKLNGGPDGVWQFDKDSTAVAVKLAELEDLRDEVRGARNKRQLAKMVLRFGEAHRGKHDKKATKNGFKFLEGLAARLKTL